MIRIGLFILLSLLGLGVGLASQHQDTDVVGSAAESLLKARFQRAGVAYPPARIQLIALKEPKRLELWAWAQRKWRHIHDYAVLAASGHAGPKLREGDKQVPEGFYRIAALNPNSNFHLSMKLDYPNAYDWEHALEEGREKPGSDIFIHGSALSTGCLAVGDKYVEELYALISSIGKENVQVMIVPYDFRTRTFSASVKRPSWLQQLYAYLQARISQFPLSAKMKDCPNQCLVHQGWYKPSN